LHGLFTEMNLLLDRPPAADRDRVACTLAELRAEVRPFGQVLGIFQQAPARWLERRRQRLVARRGLDQVHIESLIAERSDARKARDWARADAVRDALAALGVELRDGPGGTAWKVREEP
jgi:cysteinyl-tRNA synthetase